MRVAAMARIVALVSNACAPDPRVERAAGWARDAGHAVEIHAWDRSGDAPADADGIIRDRTPAPYGGGWRTLRALKAWQRRSVQRLRANPPDLLHCHDADTLPIALGLRKTHPEVLILFDMHDLWHTWFHNRGAGRESWSRRVLSGVVKRGSMRAARKADAVVTSSDGFRAWLAARGIAAEVYENRPASCLELAKPDSPLVGVFGRLRSAVDLEPLAKSGVPFILAGDGLSAEEIAKRWPNADDRGTFSAKDLPDLMAEVSVIWAVYHAHHENIAAGALPTRMFDGAAHGRASVVTAGVPMATRAQAGGLGIPLSADVKGTIEAAHNLSVSLPEDDAPARFHALLERMLGSH